MRKKREITWHRGLDRAEKNGGTKGREKEKNREEEE